jgi:hypothetical protein
MILDRVLGHEHQLGDVSGGRAGGDMAQQLGLAGTQPAVLRARTPDGIEQEVYALLVTYQAPRTALADAAATVPGTDPDRASFAIALNAARDQVILAADLTSDDGP